MAKPDALQGIIPTLCTLRAVPVHFLLPLDQGLAPREAIGLTPWIDHAVSWMEASASQGRPHESDPAVVWAESLSGFWHGAPFAVPSWKRLRLPCIRPCRPICSCSRHRDAANPPATLCPVHRARTWRPHLLPRLPWDAPTSRVSHQPGRPKCSGQRIGQSFCRFLSPVLAALLEVREHSLLWPWRYQFFTNS